MDPVVVHFELAEASHHLQELVAELHAGQIDERGEPGLAVQLSHILGHICRAWNCKDSTPEEVAGLSQEEFESLSNSVPNFMGQYTIGEYAFG